MCFLIFSYYAIFDYDLWLTLLHLLFYLAIDTLQEFVDLLYNVSTGLLGVKLNSSDLIGKRMCIVLVIISVLANLFNCQVRYLPDKVHMILSILFPMLKMTPRSGIEFVSDDLEFVLKFIKAEDRKEVATVLAIFADHFCNQHKLNSPQWIYVLPIIHRFNSQGYAVSLEKKVTFNWKEDYIRFPVYKDLEDARILDMK